MNKASEDAIRGLKTKLTSPVKGKHTPQRSLEISKAKSPTKKLPTVNVAMAVPVQSKKSPKQTPVMGFSAIKASNSISKMTTMVARPNTIKSTIHSKKTSIDFVDLNEGKIDKPHVALRTKQQSPIKRFETVKSTSTKKAQGPGLSVTKNTLGAFSAKKHTSPAPQSPKSLQQSATQSSDAVMIQSVEQLIGILGKNFNFGGHSYAISFPFTSTQQSLPPDSMNDSFATDDDKTLKATLVQPKQIVPPIRIAALGSSNNLLEESKEAPINLINVGALAQNFTERSSSFTSDREERVEENECHDVQFNNSFEKQPATKPQLAKKVVVTTTKTGLPTLQAMKSTTSARSPRMAVNPLRRMNSDEPTLLSLIEKEIGKQHRCNCPEHMLNGGHSHRHDHADDSISTINDQLIVITQESQPEPVVFHVESKNEEPKINLGVGLSESLPEDSEPQRKGSSNSQIFTPMFQEAAKATFDLPVEKTSKQVIKMASVNSVAVSEDEMAAIQRMIAASMVTEPIKKSIPKKKKSSSIMDEIIAAQSPQAPAVSSGDPEMDAIAASIQATISTETSKKIKPIKKKKPHSIIELQTPQPTIESEFDDIQAKITAQMSLEQPPKTGLAKKATIKKADSDDFDDIQAQIAASMSTTPLPIPGLAKKKTVKTNSDDFDDIEAQIAAQMASLEPANTIKKTQTEPPKVIPSIDDVEAQIQASLDMEVPKIKSIKKKRKISIMEQASLDQASASATPTLLQTPSVSQTTEPMASPTPSIKVEPLALKTKSNPKKKLSHTYSTELQPVRETKAEHKKDKDDGFGDSNDESSHESNKNDDFASSDSENDEKPVKKSNVIGKMLRESSEMISYSTKDAQDQMIEFMIKVANSLKVKPDLFEQFKSCIRPDVSMLQKRMSKAVSKIGLPKLAELAEITQIYEEYKNNLKTSKMKFTNADDDPIQRAKDAKTIEKLEFELQKARIQLNMMVLAFRKKQKESEQALLDHVNQQTELINKHEVKVQEYIESVERQKRQLHFAFMFACPLVMNYGGTNKDEKLREVPLLNYEKEYSKIKQRLEVAKVQIIITKKQCTIESFRQILQRRPLGIHFSGHGIRNTFETVGEYRIGRENDGDFLLFETVEGESQLVSREQLSKIIKKTRCELDFVFVASCHSEFVGNIFKEAGAKHVICINHENEVEDEAILNFTEAFYDAVFSNSMKICNAFRQAREAINISISSQQANIFKLFTPESDGNIAEVSNKKAGHTCKSFGGFLTGMFKEQLDDEPKFKVGSIDQPDLTGRQKEIFKLARQLLRANSNRLMTLIGLPGVGKSALARKTLLFIDQRRLLSGGYIMMNLRDMKDTEVFMRVFTETMISGYPADFSAVAYSDNQDKKLNDTHHVLDYVLTRISQFQRELVLVLDNAEELITQDKLSFKNMVKMFLDKIPKMKILLTSNVRLQNLKEYTEETVLLFELTTLQTMQLFAKLTRPISLRETNELLKIKPDLEKYPSERGIEPKKVQDHHLYRLMCGNPSTITTLAPMLMDTERPMTLSTLYKAMTSDKPLKDEDGMSQAVQISVRMSIRSLESDEECMLLMKLLSLLPGGVVPRDLDNLWVDLLKANFKNETMQKLVKRQSQLKRVSNPNLIHGLKSSNDFKWLRAFTELKKNRLIVETKLSEELIRGNDDWVNNTLIGLPNFLSKFIEAEISLELIQTFHSILTNHFLQEFKLFYFRINNQEGSIDKHVSCQFDLHQSNFWAFMERMGDGEVPHATTPRLVKKPSIKNEVVKEQEKESSGSGSDIDSIDQKLKKTDTNSSSLKKAQKLNKSADSFDSVDLSEEEIKNAKSEDSLDEELQKQKMTIDDRNMAFKNITFGTGAKKDGSDDDDDDLLQDAKYIQKTRVFDHAKFQREKQLQQLLKQKTLSTGSNGSINDNEKPKIAVPGMMGMKGTSINLKLSMIKKFSVKNLPMGKGLQPITKSNLSINEEPDDPMEEDELAVVYYITNLVLLEQFIQADSNCEKQISKLIKNSSDTFQGDIARLQALCKFEIMQARQGKKQRTTQKEAQLAELVQEVEDKLDLAEKIFKGEKEVQEEDETKKQVNHWGLGLVYYQKAEFILKQYEHAENHDEEKRQKAIKLLKKAIDEFNLVNHIRGKSLAAKMLCDSEKTRILFTAFSLQRVESNTQSKSPRPFGQKGQGIARIASVSQPAKKPMDLADQQDIVDDLDRNYNTLRNQFLKLMQKQKDPQVKDFKQEIFITRTQGDRFSLLTEVVPGIYGHIFEKMNLESSVSSRTDESDTSSDDFADEKPSITVVKQSPKQRRLSQADFRRKLSKDFSEDSSNSSKRKSERSAKSAERKRTHSSHSSFSNSSHGKKVTQKGVVNLDELNQTNKKSHQSMNSSFGSDSDSDGYKNPKKERRK